MAVTSYCRPFARNGFIGNSRNRSGERINISGRLSLVAARKRPGRGGEIGQRVGCVLLYVLAEGPGYSYRTGNRAQDAEEARRAGHKSRSSSGNWIWIWDLGIGLGIGLGGGGVHAYIQYKTRKGREGRKEATKERCGRSRSRGAEERQVRAGRRGRWRKRDES